MKAVILDPYSTLVESAPGILTSFAAVFAAHGVTPNRLLMPALIGPSLRETLTTLCTGGRPRRIYFSWLTCCTKDLAS